MSELVKEGLGSTDGEIVELLTSAVVSLERAVSLLRQEGEVNYNLADDESIPAEVRQSKKYNLRGNIRTDAASRIELDLHRIQIARDYISKALLK
jgi:hypothetical protein